MDSFNGFHENQVGFFRSSLAQSLKTKTKMKTDLKTLRKVKTSKHVEFKINITFLTFMKYEMSFLISLKKIINLEGSFYTLGLKSQIRIQAPKQILPLIHSNRNVKYFHKADFLVFFKIKLQSIS